MEMNNDFGQFEQALELAFGAILASNPHELVRQTDVVSLWSQRLGQGQGMVGVSVPRLKAAASRLQSLREAIQRNQSVTEHALRQLVPAMQSPVYALGEAGGSAAAMRYGGSVVRSSGRLRQNLSA